MKDYYKAMFGQMFALAAVAGQALTAIMPVTIAAPIAMFAAVLLTRVNDKVTDMFETDIDRILEPDQMTKARLGSVVLLAMAFASVLAPAFGAALAAVIGILIMFALMKKLME